jgi:hypothetical protein
MKAHDILTRQETIQLMNKCNLHATALLVSFWTGGMAAMLVVALWPDIVTIIIALLVIVGRQLRQLRQLSGLSYQQGVVNTKSVTGSERFNRTEALALYTQHSASVSKEHGDK